MGPPLHSNRTNLESAQIGRPGPAASRHLLYGVCIPYLVEVIPAFAGWRGEETYHGGITMRAPSLEELRKSLPQKIQIGGPLVNGETYLRSLPFPAKGPFSRGYGLPLYATASREDVLAAYAKARGSKRAEIALILNI